jgi:hypothetical protein
LKKLNDVAHKLSLSLPLSLSSPFSNLKPNCAKLSSSKLLLHPQPKSTAKMRKYTEKRRRKKTLSKPTKPNPTATDGHSLTHSLTHSFHKNEIPLQISFCEGCFLLQRHTQWPEKKYSREHDLLRQGKYKESRRTQILQQKPKKKKKKKKSSRQSKIQIRPPAP